MKKWAVVTDFDATVTTRDIGDSIILHFKAAGAREVRDSYCPGISVEKWMEEVFEKIGASPKEIREFAINNSKMRKGFGEFIRLCKKRKIPVEIVSGGLDIYIKPLFEKWGIKIKSFFGISRWINRKIKIRYPFLRDMTLGEFKASRVKAFQGLGYRVVFLGDGPSDYLAACSADMVFSRQRLYSLCRENGVCSKKLRDFYSVCDFINDSSRSKGS